MTDTSPPFPQLDALLANAEWIRSLARSLIRDPQAADDVAQEAWVKALERPPADANSVRAWMRTVVRRLGAERHRRDARRAERERDAARREATAPPASDEVERLELHRLLVDALLELREPYRSTLTLRFFEGLPPRRIAQHLGVPVKTVHTRIERGLSALRAKLDAKAGGRRTWVLALAPLAKRGAGGFVGLAGLGVLLMNAKAVVALSASVVVALLAWWALPGDSGSAATGPRDQGAGVVARPKQTTTPAAAGDASESVRSVRKETEEVVVPRPARSIVHGRVLDLLSRPVSGVDLTFHEGLWLDTGHDSKDGESIETVATSGQDGVFSLPLPERTGSLAAHDERFATLFAPRVTEETKDAKAIVVIGPALSLSGRVTDDNGRPVAKAKVAVRLPFGFRGRFPLILDTVEDPYWEAEAAADGRFDLGRIARVRGTHVLATADGWLPAKADLPARDTDSLNLVMHRAKVEQGALHGIVLDPSGVPVAGAKVALGERTTVTDTRGTFAFENKAEGKGKRLRAVALGFLPTTEQAPKDSVGRPTDWPGFVSLRLAGAALSIAGRVVDAQGNGLSRIKVWIKNPEFFGRVGPSLTPTENLMADVMPSEEFIRKLTRFGSKEEARRFLDETPRQRWNFVWTDASGRFELAGAQARDDYVLVALDPKTLLRVETGHVRGGDTNVRITVDTGACLARVSGTVTDRHGVPLAGVSVQLGADGFKLTVGNIVQSSNVIRPAITTGADGRFSFERVPRENVFIRVDGPDIIPVEYGHPGGILAASGGVADNLRIVVPRRIHVRVEVTAFDADSIAVLDDKGERVTMHVFNAGGSISSPHLTLTDGKTPAFAVHEDARTLVFYKDNKEVRREPLVLVPGKLNEIRF